MNDVVTIEHAEAPRSAVAIRAQVNLIQEVMQAVMKPDVHYGKIPGTQKPTLYKAGAECLAAAFHIAPKYRVEDLSGPDFIRYRVTCIGVHQMSGLEMGEGLGECSSMEEKYKWRKAYANEFKDAPEDRRRKKYYANEAVMQIRTEPADVANTVLKMAAKRAQVAMTLNVCAASDIFAQDIEDLPEELREEWLQGEQEKHGGQKRQPVDMPKPKAEQRKPAMADHGTGEIAKDAPAGPAVPMSATQIRILKAKAANRTLPEDALAKQFGDESSWVGGQFAAMQSWIAEQA